MKPIDIYRKTVRGLGILSGVNMVKIASGMIIQLVLARILLPEHFGRYAMASVVYGLVLTIASPGFDSYVIQKTGTEHTNASTLLTLQFMLSLILFLTILIFADRFAVLTGFPDIGLIIRSISGLLFIDPFILIFKGLLQKDLRYHASNLPTAAGFAIQTILTIVLSFAFRDVWALVIGSIAKSVTEFLFLLTSVKSDIRFDSSRLTDHTRDIIAYCWPLFISSLLVYVYWNIDDVMVGRILGEQQLGYYDFAFKIPHVLLIISSSLMAVCLPLLSKLKHDVAQTTGVFTSITKLTAYGMFLLAALVLVFGREIIIYIFDPKWLPSLVPFKIYMLVVAVRSCTVYWTTLHQSRGITKYQLVTVPVNLLSIVITGYYLTRWFGIIGMSLAVLLSIVLSVLFFVPAFTRIILPTFRYGPVLLMPVGLSGIFVLLGSAVMTGTEPVSFPVFLVYAAVFTGLYAYTAWRLDTVFLRKNFGIVTGLLKNQP